jgi:hypothetical protein
MGLMDRLQGTAQDVADKARKAGIQAQGKLTEVQLRRRMDDAARQLGYLVFRERTLGTPAGSDADTLVEQIRDLEEQIRRQHEETRAATKPGPTAPEGASDVPVETMTDEPAAPPAPPPGERSDTDSTA